MCVCVCVCVCISLDMMTHYIYIFKNIKYYLRNKATSKFQVFKFLQYKDHTRFLFFSTCVSVNKICHNEKNSTNILSLHSVPHVLLDSH